MKINTSESVKKNSLAEVSDAKLNQMIEKMGESVKNELRVPIFIPAPPEIAQAGPKHVCINGYNLYIPYNRRVTVPYSVVTLLRHQKVIL